MLAARGFLMATDGRLRVLAPGDVALIDRVCRSPHDQASYSATWQIGIRDDDNAINFSPAARDQGLVPVTDGVAVWSSNVMLVQSVFPRALFARGFAQLTGFATATAL